MTVLSDSPMAIRNLSLVAIQGLNQNIYGPVNNLHYSPLRMVARINRFGGRLHKAVEVGNIQMIQYHAVMSGSWGLALANKLGVSIQDKIWERFPGVCFHCKSGPCSCGHERLSTRPSVVASCPTTMQGIQDMFAKIYPKNVALTQAGRLMQEIAELTEAVDNFTGTNTPESKIPVIDELVDVFARLFGTLNPIGVSVAEGFGLYFSDGCYECHHTPCIHGFVNSTTFSPRKIG